MVYSVDIVTGIGRLLVMDIDSENRKPGTGETEPTGDREWLGVERVDCSELGADEVLGLMYEVDHICRQLGGYMMTMLARLGELKGDTAVLQACHKFGLSRYRARREAKTIEELKDLPQTLEALNGGLITTEHVRVISDSHRQERFGPALEQELIWAAMSEDFDDFKKTVSRHEQNRCEHKAEKRAERQRRRRKAAVFNGDDDMVVLHAELDPVAGERIKTAMDDLCDRMYRDDFQAGNDRTHQQRCADALVNLVTQAPNSAGRAGGTDVGTGDDDNEVTAQATTLLVKVDYDALTGRLTKAGLIDDTPIDIDELRQIACNAGVIPAIFSAEGVPLYLGRKQRAATQTQKLALQVRDKHCVGCGIRATACDTHHILWWEDGGTTDISNLVLLCPKCHTKIHKHEHTLTTDSQGKYQLEPPAQLQISYQTTGRTTAEQAAPT